MTPSRPRPSRQFRPGPEPLEGRDLPAVTSGLMAVAWSFYQAPPLCAVRAVGMACNLGKLAWTGRAKFAFGLVKVSHPFPITALPHFRRNTTRRKTFLKIDPKPTHFEVHVGPLAMTPRPRRMR